MTDRDGSLVSVIVPVRNGGTALSQCLDAIAAQTLSRSRFEVIVVDNASTDGSADVAGAHPLQPRVLSEARPGSYAARNAGVRASRGTVLAFTDADCRPAPGWLAAGEAACARSDIVGGRVTPQRSPRPGLWERYDSAFYLNQEQFVAEQGFAATANLFARREVFDAAGMFDESLRSSGDLEWCVRATGRGFRLAYEPAAVVQHRPRATGADTWRLHRRLGAGWAVLARRGQRAGWWHDQAMWVRLGTMIDAVNRDGPLVRRRRLAPVHLLAMTARAVGRFTRRP